MKQNNDKFSSSVVITSQPDWENSTIGEGLDRVDSLLGRIGMNSPEQTLFVLTGLDALWQRFQDIQASTSQGPLQSQFDGILATLRKSAHGFLKDLGGESALRALRAVHQPPPEHTWWYLDQWIKQRRQAELRRTGITLGSVLIGLVVLAVIYRLFFAPDPAVVARLEHEQNTFDALISGDVIRAETQVAQGLQYGPQDMELLTLQGVVLRQAAKMDQAQVAFEQAEAVAESREAFLITRGQDYLTIGDLEAAWLDAEAVLAINPNSPSAYLMIGQIYEDRQNFSGAYQSYQQASTLAEEQDQLELSAIARARLAYLIQLNQP